MTITKTGAQSFMEIIYIDSDDQARHTNKRRSAETNIATFREFRSYRKFVVGIKDAHFLLDYYDRKGNLCDTIPIGAQGFKAITGSLPQSDRHYRRVDNDFWKRAVAERDRNRKAARA